MSPIQAMERSYRMLKDMLRNGAFGPGARLEASRLADQLGVSITPVRDVLHRLTGEQLVEAVSGDGFYVPRLSEAGLRNLYEWHSALVSIALRTTREPIPDLLASLEAPADADAERTAELFERFARAAPNREIVSALASAGDRLHPFRRIERIVLGDSKAELAELAVPGSGQLQAVRRYHLRRMRAAPALLLQRSASRDISQL